MISRIQFDNSHGNNVYLLLILAYSKILIIRPLVIRPGPYVFFIEVDLLMNLP